MQTIETAGILIGMATGIAGLVLGIINALHQSYSVRPRLKIEPSLMHLVNRGKVGSKNGIEYNVGVMTILNVGSVPVMGSSIGFKLKDNKTSSLFLIAPYAINGAPWPDEILPGRSVTLRMDTEKLREHYQNGNLDRAYARTAIGDYFHASRKTMRKFEKQLEDWTEPKPDE